MHVASPQQAVTNGSKVNKRDSVRVDTGVQVSVTDGLDASTVRHDSHTKSGSTECTSVSLTRSETLANEDFAKLQYVNVWVTDDSNSSYRRVTALCDSGAEISVLRSALIRRLDVAELGQIKLRGIVGSSASADLIRLRICAD